MKHYIIPNDDRDYTDTIKFQKKKQKWKESGMSVQIPLHRITDSASNGSVFPVVTEHFSASSDHAFL